MTSTEIKDLFAASTTPALAHLNAVDARCYYDGGDETVARALDTHGRMLAANEANLIDLAAQLSREVGRLLQGRIEA